MANSPDFVAHVLELMRGAGSATARAMFGGHGIYLDGMIVGIVVADVLYLKTDDETRPGNDDVVILGHGFWQRWFGGDPGVVGRRLALQEGSLTIVGVAPPGLRIGVMEPEAYTPLPIDPANPGAIGSRAFQRTRSIASNASSRNA